ncbi:hypothetical protein K788_0001813 (plasmid) [Paraburkholderia caribensis MBA4]|uniref:Uncharacterized protein n=1 Tax=Paraburkholderia caribensis MBA4 TaxID=1323664 RepID=A0A0P0RQM0_9BURK|nr:hypothetical protein [Paraburkholderia caribensis]ALL71388.1 hypothetical protein K788_0001813 [Paraburkholderia caribensis MBA4]
MSTILERRLAVLATALAALDAPGASAAALAAKSDLESEQSNLSSAPPEEVSDRNFELAMLDWLRGFFPADGPAGLVRTLNAEPTLVALAQPSTIDLATAGAIFAVRDPHPLTLADLPALRAAAGSDAAIDELAGLAMRYRLALPPEERAYLRQDVAILLPLRIETVFDQTDAGWRMRLRIVPDEPSIRRDPTPATAFEIETLRSMWQQIYDGLSDADRAASPGSWLTVESGQHAWSQFCAVLPPHRAAWLADRHPPTVVGSAIVIDPPGDVGAAQPPNRVGGFPPRMEIWAGFGTAPVQRIDAFDVQTAELRFDVIGRKRKSDNSFDEEQDRWWVSWPTAKAVNIGRELVLPDGCGPMDIRVLYALGIGEENPEEHFRARIDAGEMAVLPLGVPTNAVDGEQAASLGVDADGWRDVTVRRLLCRQDGTVADSLMSTSLAGADANLSAMPTPSGIPALDRMLVPALWPALWGHQLRDVWGCVDNADRLAAWAIRYVRPEGPLPPVRITEQPYGLLPTSAFSAWQPRAEEGPLGEFENQLKPHLLRFRSHWADIARKHGTAVGADARALLDLISRDALTADYASRFFMPIELVANLMSAIGPFDQPRFDDFVRKTFRPLYDVLRREPSDPPGIRQALAMGDCAPLTIPLVVPTRWPHWFYVELPDGSLRLDDEGHPVPRMTPARGFAELLKILRVFGHDHAQVLERLRGVLPDSLLFRLLMQSCMLSCAAVTQANAGPTAPILEPLVGDTAQRTQLDQLSRPYNPGSPHTHPAGAVRVEVVHGIEQLIKILEQEPASSAALQQIERTFRATLDTSMHRMDPWLTGFATRRLDYMRTRGETCFKLGAYGWVEGPMPGKPGPTAGGLLHSPSHAQALTSVILRDAFVTEALETPAPVDGRNLWDMNLESRPIREAVELADEARLGSHVFEALGRRVERIVADAFADQLAAPVDLLRRAFPLRAGQPDRGVVCHGLNAIGFFLDGTPVPPTISAEDQTALNQLRAAMGPERASIAFLRSSLDAYADLLVAEAVHQVVQRRSDAAGAAMDAAAGLAAPPTLNFTQTPLSAEALSTAVIVAVPFRASPQEVHIETPPARIADNSMPDAVEAMFGAADQWRWGVDTPADLATVSLEDVGLEPIDACVLSAGFLADMFRHRLGVHDDVALIGPGPRLHRQARAFIRICGNQPLLMRDVVATNEDATDVAITRSLDSDALNELRRRYETLRDAAQKSIDDLSNAAAANDAAALAQALLHAMRWGITPTASRSEQDAMFAAIFDHLPPGDAGLLVRLADNARQSLAARLAAAPPADTTQPLGRCIAELAAPEGQLAILSRCEVASLKSKSGLDMAVEDEKLDEAWLPVVAAVRPHLARLEASQLEALTAGPDAGSAMLRIWSNVAGDHWLRAALADLEAERAKPGGNDLRLRLPRLVAAYSCGDVWQGTQAAVGLIDGWAEAIPRTRQTTTAAFGFNAPAARAPQAILLAVPPDLNPETGARLDNAALIDILEETRELAHARAVNAEELGAYLAVMPTAMLHATGPSGISLDP